MAFTHYPGCGFVYEKPVGHIHLHLSALRGALRFPEIYLLERHLWIGIFGWYCMIGWRPNE